MFNGCTNLKFVNIKNIQLHETSDYMFANCKSLISIDLSNLDFSNVKFLRNMFENCFSLQTVNLKNSNLYSAEDINNMFLNCYSLKELDFLLLNPKI
jgi:surface protein